MFYEPPELMDKVLRLGDVVRGYISASTTIKQPFLSFESSTYHNYNVRFEVPHYSVVLTPCCSIGDSMICLTPLIELRSSLSNNQYFAEDFTRINRQIEPQNAFSTDDWQTLSDGEKQEILAKKNPYTLLSLFVYEPSDLFSRYLIRKQEINYYMIDFRNVQTLRCEMIKNRDKIEREEAPILESKCLQVSKQTREELQNKLSYYYGRPVEAEVE
jgi:hypothetical protein